MSCIRFNTPAQRQAMREHRPAMLTAEEAAALHPAPEVTESKVRRLRLLADRREPEDPGGRGEQLQHPRRPLPRPRERPR